MQFIRTDFERWVEEDSEDEDEDLCATNWDKENVLQPGIPLNDLNPGLFGIQPDPSSPYTDPDPSPGPPNTLNADPNLQPNTEAQDKLKGKNCSF